MLSKLRASSCGQPEGSEIPQEANTAHWLLATWVTKYPQFRHLQKSSTWFFSESPVLRCQWKHPVKGKKGTKAWPLVPLLGQDMGGTKVGAALSGL